MKKLLLSILLVCFLAVPVRAAFPFHGFFDVSWGTDKQQIIKDTGGIEQDGFVVSVLTRESGVKISFLYEFDKQNKLQRVTTFARPPGALNDQAMLEFCSRAGSNFANNFGMYDMAETNVFGGQLFIWANEDTEVHMMCDFKNKTFVTLFQKSTLPRILVLPNKTQKSRTL